MVLSEQTVQKRKNAQEGCDHPEERPVPIRELFVYPVILSISNYVVLAFLNSAASAVFPLFLAMPLEIGGFNLDPPTIGWIIGIYGTSSAVFQALYFSRIVDYLGVRKVFLLSTSMYLIIFSSFPAINIAALMFGNHSILAGLLILSLLVALSIMDSAYGMFLICS
jgi:hypothetical protein